GASWPARLQRLTSGPLVDALPEGVTLWLDGGHNPAAGAAIAAHLGDGAPLYLIAGMLDTKAAGDFARPLAPGIASVVARRTSGASGRAKSPAALVSSMPAMR
ncbi:MAG: bifunctional folylpolyglutamate synthase/dihydrofolate synthase, partial [Pseudomonadota bacterium]